MKKTILLIVLSMLLLCAMAVPAMAQEWEAGVEVGDWFKYEVKLTQWISEGPFPPTLGPLTLADNETNWIRYAVTDISFDGNVTFLVTYNWKNGSETTATPVENMTYGPYLTVIGANMTEGEMVSDAFLFMDMVDYPARYLNASIMLDNPNATRETNVLNYTIDLLGTPYDYVFYWDKATGMRVYYENHGDVPDLTAYGGGPAYEYTVAWELVDSSVEDVLVPDLTGPILLAAFIAITVPIVLYKRKKLFI